MPDLENFSPGAKHEICAPSITPLSLSKKKKYVLVVKLCISNQINNNKKIVNKPNYYLVIRHPSIKTAGASDPVRPLPAL